MSDDPHYRQIIEDWLNDLPDAEERAQRIAHKLQDAGFVVLRHADAQRAVDYIPNGCCERSLPFRERMEGALAAQRRCTATAQSDPQVPEHSP